jgi:hypothetical protein
MFYTEKPFVLAEREGFEPSVPGKGYARLAIWCLRPLGHLSARRKYSGGPKLCGYIEMRLTSIPRQGVSPNVSSD